MIINKKKNLRQNHEISRALRAFRVRPGEGSLRPVHVHSLLLSPPPPPPQHHTQGQRLVRAATREATGSCVMPRYEWNFFGTFEAFSSCPALPPAAHEEGGGG